MATGHTPRRSDGLRARPRHQGTVTLTAPRGRAECFLCPSPGWANGRTDYQSPRDEDDEDDAMNFRTT
ncbi:hypothetical protein GCM10010353_57490 [Streptomyces chryseus]|nr:hypothetical protein GCM10010353_57490 [Streptomyces chryseus]